MEHAPTLSVVFVNSCSSDNFQLFTLNRISAQAREDGKEAKYQRISLRTTVDTHQGK